MAGSEKSGFANSKPILIENAYFVLTPSAKVAKKKVDAYASFVESLRALPIVLDYHEHDIVTRHDQPPATYHCRQVWSTLSETPTLRMS